MKKRYFFENEDADHCYTEAYFQEKMKDEELAEITVLGANKSKEKDFFYCKAIGEVCSMPPDGEPCGQECTDYEPRNGKSGCCRYRSTLFEHGEEVILKLKSIPIFQGLEKFGKVEQNEKIGNSYHIKITKGFKTTATNCKKLFTLIMETIPENNLAIEKFITDENLYHLILTYKTK